MVSMDAIDLGNARKAAGAVGQARLGAYASSEAALARREARRTSFRLEIRLEPALTR